MTRFYPHILCYGSLVWHYNTHHTRRIHMATMNGVTPEQLAKEIIADTVESKMIDMSGTAFQKLETVVCYLNRDKIAARSQAWYKKNFDSLVTDAVETLVSAREK